MLHLYRQVHNHKKTTCVKETRIIRLAQFEKKTKQQRNANTLNPFLMHKTSVREYQNAN